MRKFTLYLKMCFFIIVCLVFAAFSEAGLRDEQTEFIRQLLSEHHDSTQGKRQIRRYELNVLNSGFCRYKRYFDNGKVEFFSFNLEKFRDMDYYGTDKQGVLYLRTKGEDVIVQTYHDRRGGDIDSMSSYMAIPLKEIEPEQLTALSERLVRLNAQRLAQK